MKKLIDVIGILGILMVVGCLTVPVPAISPLLLIAFIIYCVGKRK
jgi:hypothetical protein